MNWLTNVVRPKIRNMLRRETPENLWIKCPDSGQLVFYKDVEANQFVIPGSNYHMRMNAVARLKSIFDNETWYDVALPDVTPDPLKFRDEKKYVDRIKDARARTNLNDAIKVGYGKRSKVPPSSSRCRISTSWAARSAWPRAKPSCAGSSSRSRRSHPSSCSPPVVARACRKASCR
ncbi:hypothetical protein ACVWZ6_001024 [Bradyrhizobium sp. GM6.1]